MQARCPSGSSRPVSPLMLPPPPTLSSTAHPCEDLHRFVNELNVRYNVGIPIPAPSPSPAKREESETAAGRIYRRLETHFLHGGVVALDSILQQFDDRTREFWSMRVKKPLGDAELLSTPLRPPLAANLTEREWLQALFNDVLDKAQPVMPATRSFTRTQSGPAALEGSRSTTINASRDCLGYYAQPKRPADAELRDAAKRAKADPIRDLTSSALLSRRQPSGTSASARVQPRSGSSQSFKSLASKTTTTNTSFPSAVFSASSVSGTQETIEASTQEQDLPLPSSSQTCTQDSYIDAPSSTMEDALRISFNEHEASFGVGARDPLLSSSQGTESFPPSSATAEALLHSTYEDQSKGTAYLFDVDGKRMATSIFAAPPLIENAATITDHSTVQERLHGVWPTFPSWLQTAPFPVAWEATRIAESCGVDLNKITNIAYHDSWRNQQELRDTLSRHKAFQGKTLPVQSSDTAWAASLEQSKVMPFDQQVVYSTSLDFNSKSNPLGLTIQPLKLEQSHRLGRRFGSDRFLELLVPSPDTSNLPAFIKDTNALFFEGLVEWLKVGHTFCGRGWKAFYTRSGGSRKPVKDLQFGPDPRPVFKERIYFFAEEGVGNFPGISMPDMVDWALELKNNRSQPVLKLFQRIALVLSKTSPTVVFEPAQIKHQSQDIQSCTSRKVMNDGVARMSPAVARAVQASLGLSTTPSAVQGRLGSAKGMWIIDVTDKSDVTWIETFPSQCKWKLDWSMADVEHRTLEIRNVASVPRSASFNLQFLPVLEDRAVEKTLMRKAVGDLLTTSLRRELDGQKKAVQNPLQFRQWTYENSVHKEDRLSGHVPYQGAMPQTDEEIMNTMLDAGFDPQTNKLLNGLAYDIQLRKCQILSKKLNITVPRSAYLYMVVDFTGTLEENEVHIGFSTSFSADDEWSKTMVHGIDVLVARSPAHFISDIQKVKATFKPELADLTNVIVFSSKGDTPLAEKLSGGDYDGDLAWVCWDFHIVNNFENAELQEQPDLSRYMPSDQETFRHLLLQSNKHRGKAVADMMAKSFQFNLSKSMLGVCTNFKERLCYERNNVCDAAARTLSTLLSNLVDQAKQGLHFTPENFTQLRQELGVSTPTTDLAYKQEVWPSNKPWPPRHIIDHLKFFVAKPAIDNELEKFHASLESRGGTHHWDADLAVYYKGYRHWVDRPSESNSLGRLRKSMGRILGDLIEDLKNVAACWDAYHMPETISYSERVARVYEVWVGIQPRSEDSERAPWLLLGGEMSHWMLLKASTAFWMFCNSGNSSTYGMKPRFVWQMACRHLCYIKSQAASGAPAVVIPLMFACLRPDAKFVKRIEARLQGGSQFGLGDGDPDDNGSLVDEDE